MRQVAIGPAFVAAASLLLESGAVPTWKFLHAFQSFIPGRARWHAIRIAWLRLPIGKRNSMEPIRRQTVAPPTVASLRGDARSTPVWWEAFDDEGSRRRRVLHNPSPRSDRVIGAGQMSVAAPKAHGLAMQDAVRRDLVSHSFLFSTGLCEKERIGSAALPLVAGRHK